MAEILEQARAAYAAHRWDDAYRAYGEAAEGAVLDARDLAAFADASWWLGHTDESLSLSEEVYRRHLHGEHLPQAARLAIEIGFLWLLRGEPTVGSGWVQRAARLLEGQPECVEHGYLLYLEVEEAMAVGDLTRAIETARRIREIADRFDDATLGAIALVLEGTAVVKQGRVGEGLAVLDEAMLPVHAGLVQPNWAGNLYCHLMSLFFELADIRRARAWTDATERWCDQYSNAAMFVGICRVHRAQLLHLEGAWEDAERHASQACRDLVDMNVEVVAEGHYQIGELRRLRDDHEGAEAAFARAHELGRDPHPGLARLRLAQGRVDAAATALRAALATAEQPLERAPLLAAQVEVLAAATGDPGMAADAAAELADIAEAFGTPGLLASARQAAGLAHLAAGEPERAVPLLRDACQRWRELDARYEAARVRGRLGHAYGAVGDDEAAQREIAAAIAVLEDLGAVGEARIVARSAAGPARHERMPGGLTSRELEVLACMAAGRTNRQIAATLTISERTVERHLSNIFVKLGTSSRTEAAAVAFAHGLADPAAR